MRLIVTCVVLALALSMTGCGAQPQPPTRTVQPRLTSTKPPTVTPRPSATSVPTRTASPTATLVPTATMTPTPEPTSTPEATATAEPAETGTPIPSTATRGVIPLITKTVAVRATPVPVTEIPATSSNPEADALPCKVGQIKGNKNTMIYHVPSGAWYAQTRKNVVCFDTEAAAQAAGYRKSRR
jgi:hypothetical protein